MLRKIAAIPLFIASFLFVVAFVFGAFYQNSASFASSVDYAIEKIRVIEGRFILVSEHIDSYKKEKGSLPTQDEYQNWLKSLPDMKHHPKDFIRYYIDDFPSGVIDQFGEIPRGHYILSLWRGEWHEYYYSATDSSTLVFYASKYLQPLVVTVGQLLVAILLFLIGMLVLSKRLTNASKIAHAVR